MIKATDYISFLSKKHKNQKTIDERTEFINQMQQFFTENSLVCTTENISKFFESKAWSAVLHGKLFDCMEEYVPFIKKECKDPEAITFAETVNDYMQSVYLQTALNYVENRGKNILPIPDGVKINPIYLGEFDNGQFITAFRALQQLIINTYSDIYNAPFDWGYPDFRITEGYYNRVNDILLAFVYYGDYKNSVLTVDAKKFFADTSVKRHKNIEKMVEGFRHMGFVIEGYDKKAAEFVVSYPENPHIIAVLRSYATAMKDLNLQFWMLDRERSGFSYRFIEDPATQEYETVFHAVLDYEPTPLQQIQHWLHAEAAKYGFAIDPKEWGEKGMILYKKSSKRFMLVGSKNGAVVSKVILRDVFNSHKEQAEKLAKRFPDTFLSNCGFCNKEKPCTMRISYELSGEKRNNCAYRSFWFNGLALDDIKELLELFKIENKIR